MLPVHHVIKSVLRTPLKTPLYIGKSGVYGGINYFSYFGSNKRNNVYPYKLHISLYKVRFEGVHTGTLAQLRNALINEWNNIPMRTVNVLVNPIQRRIRVATAPRGGHAR